MPLHPLEQIDLGLLRLLLDDGEEDEAAPFRLATCLLAVSADATCLAVGRGARLLLMPFRGVGAPLPLKVPADDSVRSMVWLPARDQPILLAGFSSGRLAAYAPRAGQPLWSAAVHATPLV